MSGISQATYSDCHGCSLCLLPCPMWRQQRDVAFSPQGLAKAMQHGTDLEQLHQQFSSCILCGACDVICPEHIDFTTLVRQAWQLIGLHEEQQATAIEPDAFAISCDDTVQQQINSHDLYVIDAAPFHAYYAERVAHYDALRHKTGCRMNLDLNRMAIATGIGSVSNRLGLFDVKEQLTWLLQGHDIQRIIVENKHDVATLAALTEKEVVHIYTLIGNYCDKNEEVRA